MSARCKTATSGLLFEMSKGEELMHKHLALMKLSTTPLNRFYVLDLPETWRNFKAPCHLNQLHLRAQCRSLYQGCHNVQNESCQSVKEKTDVNATS